MGAGGKVWAKVYSLSFFAITLASEAPSTAPLSFRAFEGDRLAVVVEGHQHGHVLLGPADAEVHAIDEAVQHMGRVEFTVDQLIAHAGPGGFLWSG